MTLADFEETGAYLTGHFRLSSGLHSDRYLQCARLLMWPDRAERAGSELASKLAEFSPEIVVSPALGGIVVGHEVARALGVRALFAERKDGAFALRRGFAIASGERAGRLAQVMERIAEFAEQELDAAVKQVTSFIEPLMIVFMGVVIGGIALALLLPIFSMGKIMTGK